MGAGGGVPGAGGGGAGGAGGVGAGGVGGGRRGRWLARGWRDRGRRHRRDAGRGRDGCGVARAGGRRACALGRAAAAAIAAERDGSGQRGDQGQDSGFDETRPQHRGPPGTSRRRDASLEPEPVTVPDAEAARRPDPTPTTVSRTTPDAPRSPRHSAARAPFYRPLTSGAMPMPRAGPAGRPDGSPRSVRTALGAQGGVQLDRGLHVDDLVHADHAHRGAAGRADGGLGGAQPDVSLG